MAYVDYDPVVVSHWRALLRVGDLSIMVKGDLRHPAELLALQAVRAHLDFGQPMAVDLFTTLHFLLDAESPGHCPGRLDVRRPRMPRGSLSVSAELTTS